MLNLDWLHVLVEGARFICSKRDYPRAWDIQVPVIIVDTRGRRRLEGIGYTVREATLEELGPGPVPPGSTEREIAAENMMRFRKARQKMHNDVIVAARERRFQRQAFRAMFPAPPGRIQVKVARLAQKAFETDCRVIHVDGSQWGLKHVPTGCVVFFAYDGQDKAELKTTALTCLDALEHAIAEHQAKQSTN